MHHWPVTTPTQTWQRLDLVTRPEVRLPPRAPGATCLDLVVHSPNPSLPEGPTPGETTQAPKSLSVVDQGSLNWDCRVTLVRHPHLLAGARWKAVRSKRVCGLRPRTSFCGRRWPWLAETSRTQSGLVKEEEKIYLNFSGSLWVP
jgi:hypothetical protein